MSPSLVDADTVTTDHRFATVARTVPDQLSGTDAARLITASRRRCSWAGGPHQRAVQISEGDKQLVQLRLRAPRVPEPNLQRDIVHGELLDCLHVQLSQTFNGERGREETDVGQVAGADINHVHTLR